MAMSPGSGPPQAPARATQLAEGSSTVVNLHNVIYSSIDPKAATGVVPVDVVRRLSGLEFIQGLSDGRFPRPPIAALMDFLPVEVERGRVVFEATPGEQHYNPLGAVHGGYIATLLDSCMGCAVHTELGPGQGYSTLELKVNFVRRVSTETGPVRAEGKVIHV